MRRLLIALWVLALLGVLVLISTRPPKAAGGYEFSLETSKDAPRIRVEYLSYGTEHRLLTCGPRPATTFDVRLNRLVRWIGIQRFFTPTAYLRADRYPNEQELVVYASFSSSSNLQSMPEALSAYYVDEHHRRMPMEFTIGKSNHDRTRHLIAWSVSLPTTPAQSCRVEIVQPVSGKRYALITDLKAEDATGIELAK